MADFPFFKSNLSDYPSMNGLDGQSYKDTFDYSKYQRPAVLRLLSVPWKSDYADVVRFEDEAARDSWFARRLSTIVEYSTPWLRIPAQSVNIPLPYERAAHFNYLYVDIPQMPVDGSNEPTRLFYFIRSVRYAAPSTTTLELELDFWQTYGYRMEVTSLMLERGHAPMYRTTVDEFLSDPINNNGYLLAQDVNYSTGSERVASVDHRDIGAGDKWLLLALPITPTDLANVGTGSASSSTPPAYSDTADRNGYQLAVSGYNWSANGYSYANATLPASSGLSSDHRTLDGCMLYACAYDLGASAALASIALTAPQILAAARYIAIVPSALINYENLPPINLFGATFWVVKSNPQVDVESFELTRENINLPDYAADIAKLYTSPYTRLVIQDQEGRGFEVRIEDIAGNALDFNIDVALSSVALLWNIEAVNVGTDSAESITWKILDGQITSTLYGSDLAAHMIEWDVPTYSVTLSAGALEAARKWKELEAQRQAALNTYHQAVRAANTALANTQAANATAVTNTSNAGNTATANQTLANTRDNTITTQNTTTNSALAVLSHQQAYDLSAADDEFQMYAVDVGNWGSAMAGVNNAVGALASGNALGAMSTGFGAALSITTNQAMADLAEAALLAKQGATVGYIDSVASTQNTATANNNATAVTAATSINSNNVTLNNTNATNSANTSNANAGYTRADSVTAAKENLEQAQRAAENALSSASMSLLEAGSTTGDNALDALARRAFTIKAVTQSEYALKATADYFTRYGYALNAPIYPDSWLEQGEWCYWKGSRAIIKGDVPDVYRTALESILEQGFTVWSSPEKVGNYEQEY